MWRNVWRRVRGKKAITPPPPPPGLPLSDIHPYDVLAVIRNISPLADLREIGAEPPPKLMFNILARQPHLEVRMDLPAAHNALVPGRLRLVWPEKSEGEFLLAYDNTVDLPGLPYDGRSYRNIIELSGVIHNGNLYAQAHELKGLIPGAKPTPLTQQHLAQMRLLHRLALGHR
jgi:hypothetical protein